MQHEHYDSHLKLRIPSWLRRVLEDRARAEERELSDIARRALKDYALKPASKDQSAKEK